MKTTHLSWIAFAVLMAASTAVNAAAQRTFVASNGVDTNPCSIVAPCRSFGAAIGKTLAGGELIVLDSAGYGPVTITQSVSIIAPAGVYAGISVFAGDGIVVNGAGLHVVLRGLTINGLGGQNGINFLAGLSLRIENCVIAGMAINGIQAKSANARVDVIATQIRDSAQSGIYLEGPQRATLDGVRAEANGFGIYARSGPAVVILRSRATANNADGIAVESSTMGTTMSVSESASTHNAVGIRIAVSAGLGANVTVERTVIEGNSADGISDDFSIGGGQLTVEGSKVIRNGGGINYGTAGGGEVRHAMLTHNLVDQNASIGIVLQGLNTTGILSGNVVTRNNYGVYLFGAPGAYTRSDNTIGSNVTADVANGPMSPLAAF